MRRIFTAASQRDNKPTEDKVIIVVLRQPRSRLDETRADPYWEFGSFGITTCHGHNILHPKNKDIMNGVRLAFAQGGREGFKMVYLTPSIQIKEHKNCCEAKWKGEMPLTYQDAPLLIDNEGNSLFPLLKKEIAGANCKSWMQKFSSRFRSRCQPIDSDILTEVIKVYNEVACRGARAVSYVDALPYSPPTEDIDRRKSYEEAIRRAKGDTTCRQCIKIRSRNISERCGS